LYSSPLWKPCSLSETKAGESLLELPSELTLLQTEER
jgi:hypothetical protein